MNTGDGACVSELAALRLCGLRVPWRLCGFAACAFHGGFAALTLFRVRACTRTRVQCICIYALRPRHFVSVVEVVLVKLVTVVVVSVVAVEVVVVGT